MKHSFGSHVCRAVALAWSAFSIVYLLVVSALILQNPDFPLNIGVINTTGRVGLWVTLIPAMIGLAGVVLVLAHITYGSRLLGLYSLFCAGVLVCGLPAIWNAKHSFCTRTICITTPWIGRLLMLVLTLPFLLVAFWTYHAARQGDHKVVASPTPTGT